MMTSITRVADLLMAFKVDVRSFLEPSNPIHLYIPYMRNIERAAFYHYYKFFIAHSYNVNVQLA